MAIDVDFSGPAELDIDFATAPDLDIDLLPDHRLGQHVDFDDSVQTVGYIITRKAGGTFDMQVAASATTLVHSHESAGAGGLLGDAAINGFSIGASPPGSPSNGWVFIHTDSAGPVTYTYDSVRAHWLGMPEMYLIGFRGTSGSNVAGRIGAVTAAPSLLEGFLLPYDMVLVGYEENASAHPATAGAVIQVERDDVTFYSIVVDSAINPLRSFVDTLDLDFAAGGTLALFTAGYVGNTMIDSVVTLRFRRKFV